MFLELIFLQGDLHWLFCEFQNLKMGTQKFDNVHLREQWFTALKRVFFPPKSFKVELNNPRVLTLSFSQVIDLNQGKTFVFQQLIL